jgi:hypothetical protein
VAQAAENRIVIDWAHQSGKAGKLKGAGKSGGYLDDPAPDSVRAAPRSA